MENFDILKSLSYKRQLLICRTVLFCLASMYLLLLLNVSPLFGQDLKVVTFNIRFDNAADGINAWPYRIPLVKSFLLETKPDILGVQEALHHQVLDLENILTEYYRVGTGRDDGRIAGEYSPVFFRKEKFELLEHGQFWLSQTPSSPGSIGLCAALPRITTWAHLRIKNSGKSFFVFNTHFCHMNDVARWFSANVMSDKMNKIAGDKPKIVTGDFNLDVDSEMYRKMAELFLHENRLKNAVTLHLPYDQKSIGTFNAFKYIYNQPFIDYIFISQQFTSINSSIHTITSEGVFISDHWPVELTLKFDESNK